MQQKLKDKEHQQKSKKDKSDLQKDDEFMVVGERSRQS